MLYCTLKLKLEAFVLKLEDHKNFKSKSSQLQHEHGFSQRFLFQEKNGRKFESALITAKAVDSKEKRSTCAGPFLVSRVF